MGCKIKGFALWVARSRVLHSGLLDQGVYTVGGKM